MKPATNSTCATWCLKLMLNQTKTIRIISVLFLCIISINIFGQKTQEDLLIESFLALKSKEITEDKVALSRAVQKFDEQLIYTLENYDITIFNTFKKGLDSLYSDFFVKKWETGNYELFTLRNGLDRWDYALKDKKVVLKALKTFDYFYEIHTLPKDEFLLIKRMDEISFSCYEAFVYHKNGQDSKSKMNIRGNKVLSVCSWTNVDGSYSSKDPVTGNTEWKGGMEYLKVMEIEFNPKTEIISYSFNRMKDGKTITRKAKYKNGGFKIKSYDARTFEE